MKLITIEVNEDGSLNIKAEGMNAYEVLGVLDSSIDIIKNPQKTGGETNDKARAKATRRKKATD